LLVVIDSRLVDRSPWVLLELFIARLTLTPIIRIPSSLIEAGHNNAMHAKPDLRASLSACKISVPAR